MAAKLLTAAEEFEPSERQRLAEAAARLRLTVSGSAALPMPLFDRSVDRSFHSLTGGSWKALVGQPLLERYGPHAPITHSRAASG